MPRNKLLEAQPLRLKFSDDYGYTMTAKITNGPMALLDRIIRIPLTPDQLDKIGEWNPTEEIKVLYLNTVENDDAQDDR